MNSYARLSRAKPTRSTKNLVDGLCGFSPTMSPMLWRVVMTSQRTGEIRFLKPLVTPLRRFGSCIQLPVRFRVSLNRCGRRLRLQAQNVDSSSDLPDMAFSRRLSLASSSCKDTSGAETEGWGRSDGLLPHRSLHWASS